MHQYFCPYCHAPVAAGERACRRCGQALTWTPGHTTQKEADVQEGNGEQQGGKRSWLWPLLALIFIIVLVGAGIFILLRMSEKPPVIPAEVPPSGEQHAPIIPDTRAPVISNISVNNISYNTVEIKWTTDEPSTSQVIWRTLNTNISSTDEKEAMVNQHVVELIDLPNKQRYYFKVRSVDQSHNEAISIEDTFDIGLSQGVTAISVKGDSMKSEEPQPSVFRTVISGKVVNTGDTPVRARDIEVWIKITVAGKTCASDIKADLDPTPEILNPLYEIGFRAVVPDRTDPQYIITSKIVDQGN